MTLKSINFGILDKKFHCLCTSWPLMSKHLFIQSTTFIYYCRERRMLAPVVSFLWVEILQQSKILKMDPLKCLPLTTPIGHMTASRRMRRACLLRGLAPLNTQTRYRFLNASILLYNCNLIFYGVLKYC